MRLLGVRVLWIGLGLLALFVVFVEFVVDVGGNGPGIPHPTPPRATFEIAAPPWGAGERELSVI